MVVVWGAAMFMLIFIRDLGSSLMFFAAFLALLYVATGRFSFVVIGMAMFVVGAWFFAETVPHVHDRVEVWLHPYPHYENTGYQILQSTFAQPHARLFRQGSGPALTPAPGLSGRGLWLEGSRSRFGRGAGWETGEADVERAEVVLRSIHAPRVRA